MPRNGSGVMSKPAGTTFVPNTVIESSKVNALADDIINDLNAARPITAGGTGEVTAVGAIDSLLTKGTAVASASTTDIAAATGRFIHITGTATITALGTASAGVERVVTIDGALTLTHNATSLILPGAANIATAAGDTAFFVSEGSGNWRCTSYQRAAGLGSQTIEVGSLDGLSTKTILLPAGYSSFRFIVKNVNLANGSQPFWFQTSVDSGATFSNNNGDYTDQFLAQAGTTGSFFTSTTPAAGILLNASADGQSRGFVTASIDPGSSTMPASFLISSKYLNTVGDLRRLDGAVIRNSLARINALKVFPGTGTITNGQYILIGEGL